MAKKVVLVGAGNVAWSLAQAIDALPGYTVTAIYGRSREKAQAIASRLEAAASVDDLRKIPTDADLGIISLADGAIEEIVTSIPSKETTTWIHTSGGIGMEVLVPLSARHGVLYPLQTFTYGRTIGLEDVPLFYEGSSEEATREVELLARELSASTYHADSAGRRRLHVAGVFACNFANFLWGRADELLKGAGYDFAVMGPLIKETLSKALEQGARQGQTGPARRGDMNVINGHLSTLSGDDAEIYRFLTERILKTYNHDTL